MKNLVGFLVVAGLMLSGAAMAQQPGNPEQQAKRKACRDEAAMVYRASRAQANNQMLGQQRRAHVQQCMSR